MMKQLEVILKTVERCNINCTYCYMFNMGDKTYNNRPPYMSEDVAVKTIKFIKTGCIELGIDNLLVTFHGGEPLMQKKSSFSFFCEQLYKNLSELVNVNLFLHTNAMLIDDEWINLFYRYKVGVGVSIDGVKKFHDTDRKDKRGKGTYDRVVRGIKQLSENTYMKEMGNYGLLCVINPQHNAKEIYRHFVDELGARCIDFLLPHCNYDNPPIALSNEYGQYMLTIFNEWIKDDDPTIYIRFISSLLDVILGKNSHYMYGLGVHGDQKIPIICINSDGGLTPTDEFRSITTEIVYTESTIENISLKDYFQLPLFRRIDAAVHNLAKQCYQCEWLAICNGGSIVNRYSASNGFDNPSVYCSGLKVLYQGIFAYLKENIPSNYYQIISKLGNTSSSEKCIP